jgi:hypothetical protein
MIDIKETDGASGNKMFLYGTERVADGHVITSEWSHFGPCCDMPRMKAGLIHDFVLLVRRFRERGYRLRRRNCNLKDWERQGRSIEKTF